jgi:hypothetical protein
MGGSVKTIQINRGSMADGKLRALAQNPECDKDADSIFLKVHCKVQPGKRKPPVRKTELPERRKRLYEIVGYH